MASQDLVALVASLPVWSALEYERRLTFQERNLAVQLVAWMHDTPVGRAMLVLPGHPEWSTSAHREGCPEVRDVEVAEAWRRRGVATVLLRSCEQEAGRAEFGRVGLMVGASDEYGPARALYERLGYSMSHGPFISSARLQNDDGSCSVVAGVCCYLIKDVETPRHTS